MIHGGPNAASGTAESISISIARGVTHRGFVSRVGGENSRRNHASFLNIWDSCFSIRRLPHQNTPTRLLLVAEFTDRRVRQQSMQGTPRMTVSSKQESAGASRS